jgi:hypothetical protein
MEKLLIEDLGSTIDGWAARVDGSIVCIATPRIAEDAGARRHVRGLVKRLGGDCETCGGCLIGREAHVA